MTISVFSFDWPGRLDVANIASFAMSLFSDKNQKILITGGPSKRSVKIKLCDLMDLVKTSFFSGLEVLNGKGFVNYFYFFENSLTGSKTIVVSVNDGMIGSFDVRVKEIIDRMDLLGLVGYGMVMDEPEPVYYAMGIIDGIPETREQMDRANKLSEWNFERIRKGMGHFRHLKGFFRDIYPINFLNDNHLAADFSGVSLRERVECDSRFGVLTKLSTCWLWCPRPGNIKEIREMARASGALL